MQIDCNCTTLGHLRFFRPLNARSKSTCEICFGLKEAKLYSYFSTNIFQSTAPHIYIELLRGSNCGRSQVFSTAPEACAWKRLHSAPETLLLSCGDGNLVDTQRRFQDTVSPRSLVPSTDQGNRPPLSLCIVRFEPISLDSAPIATSLTLRPRLN